MDRRQYLVDGGKASVAGFVLLAGCLGNDGSNGNDGDGGSGGRGNGNGDEDGAANTGGGSKTVPSEDTGSIVPPDDDEAIDTGQAPPDETGTPFENTNTVPEVEGLETGRAPNGTDEGT